MPYVNLDGRPGVAELDVAHTFPEWIDRAMFVGFLTVAVLTSTADVERQWLFIALLAVAVLPSAVELVRAVPSGLFAAVVLIPLAILNWAPASVGLQDSAGTSQASLLIATFLVGQTVATAPRRTAIWVVAVCFALPIGRALVDDGYQALPIWVGSVVIGITIGLVLRKLIASMADLKAAEDGLAEKAATDERQRIAREVHDVIAHSLTVTMLHITAARLAVGARRRRGRHRSAPGGRTDRPDEPHRDPADGGTAAHRARRRHRGAPAERCRHRAAGRRIRDRRCRRPAGARRQPRRCRPPAGLTAFRVVQESLADAVRHQPGSATLVAVEADDELHLRITSEGGRRRSSGCGPGNGLQGMRERVEALRGTFAAGPLGRSAWLVECRLPKGST